MTIRKRSWVVLATSSLEDHRWCLLYPHTSAITLETGHPDNVSRKLLQGIISARRDLCKAICSGLLCHGVVPMPPAFCWKCSSNQHEAYTCHELMRGACQGLHLGSINRVEETFQGRAWMFNPLPTDSLSLPGNQPLAKLPPGHLRFCFCFLTLFGFGQQTGERKVNRNWPSSAMSVGLFK